MDSKHVTEKALEAVSSLAALVEAMQAEKANQEDLENRENLEFFDEAVKQYEAETGINLNKIPAWMQERHGGKQRMPSAFDPHNPDPDGPDEVPPKGMGRVELGVSVWTPCPACNGAGIITCVDARSHQCDHCHGDATIRYVVSLNQLLTAQGVRFDAEKAMSTAFDLADKLAHRIPRR